MKQSAAKTLGVAALGAAFAAAGAGAANAAPVAPDAAQALDGIHQTLPAQHLTGTLPGADQALAQGQNAAGMGLAAAQPATQKLLADGPAAPVKGLLGGLPVGRDVPSGDLLHTMPVGKPLPAHGLPTDGLPSEGLFHTMPID
ncbi:ATP-binding protein [Streptomyces luteolifulvus]|jgi:hypothetical protein|uniref:ATP-binding protein n=1 Tax=Streptomyces luteolifulvus TaxID=2615112 RepID=A0A6H9UPT4_9ACTN|nr:ATP-binding protein [Streptomyces luteolifulvus]KAB1140290.1 ATP-binding protein [Streptomyces luteolifulvus]